MNSREKYIAVGAATGDILFTGHDEAALMRQINAKFPSPGKGIKARSTRSLLPEPIWIYPINIKTGKRV
ncbi:hypothetical protein [Fructobacillus tropaeoli]|uniref:hypothetical protein n=1 Tax=Fructobacillus tropaeoli TaxID=709323 RepID=UPI002D993568|nr:unnamed protein product [Fructobacillus tropaeoli]